MNLEILSNFDSYETQRNKLNTNFDTIGGEVDTINENIVDITSDVATLNSKQLRANLASSSWVTLSSANTLLMGVTGVLPVANGGTGSTTGLTPNATYATTSGVLGTARGFLTNLANTSYTSFNGSANCVHGVTGTLPVANGGTGVTSLSALGTALSSYVSSDLIGFTTNTATSFGYSSPATGVCSVSMGYVTSATGTGSVAIGTGMSSTGSGSIAIGTNSISNSTASIALGSNVTSSGVFSLAIGYQPNATANNSTAIGYFAKAIGINSTALGGSSSANGTYATSVGYGANAYVSSTAVGTNSKATGTNSSAFGLNAQASNTDSVAIGMSATASGYQSVALGSQASAVINRATAVGYFTTVGTAATNSTALGYYATVYGANSTALGHRAVVATGVNNTIQLGNASSLSNLSCRVSLTVTSDEREKADIEPIISSLDFLSKIETVSYVFNHREDYVDDIEDEIVELEEKQSKHLERKKHIELLESTPEFIIDEESGEEIVNPEYITLSTTTFDLVEEFTEQDEEILSERKERREKRRMFGLYDYDRDEHAKATKKHKRRRVGVKAQQVRDTMIDVYGTDNYADLVYDSMYDVDDSEIPEGAENTLGVNYNGFIPFLIDAVKELKVMNEELKAKNDELEERLSALEG